MPITIKGRKTDKTFEVELCGCEESAHLRAALNKIFQMAHSASRKTHLEDIVDIMEVAEKGLTLKKL